MIRRKVYYLLLASLLLLINFSASANGPGSYGLWPTYYGSAAINDDWGIWAEAQYRNYDFALDMEQLLLRTAVTRNLGPDNNQQVALGYAFVHSTPYVAGTDEKRSNNEHRIYQQLILKQRFGRFYGTHRYRLEERFFESDFRVRFRYFISGNFCLNKPDLSKGAVFLSAYNEIFLHADRPVFDRNRTYGGLGYVFNNNLRLEAGTMWQMLESGTRPQAQIILWHNIRL